MCNSTAIVDLLTEGEEDDAFDIKDVSNPGWTYGIDYNYPGTKPGEFVAFFSLNGQAYGKTDGWKDRKKLERHAKRYCRLFNELQIKRPFDTSRDINVRTWFNYLKPHVSESADDAFDMKDFTDPGWTYRVSDNDFEAQHGEFVAFFSLNNHDMGMTRPWKDRKRLERCAKRYCQLFNELQSRHPFDPDRNMSVWQWFDLSESNVRESADDADDFKDVSNPGWSYTVENASSHPFALRSGELCLIFCYDGIGYGMGPVFSDLGRLKHYADECLRIFNEEQARSPFDPSKYQHVWQWCRRNPFETKAEENTGTKDILGALITEEDEESFKDLVSKLAYAADALREAGFTVAAKTENGRWILQISWPIPSTDAYISGVKRATEILTDKLGAKIGDWHGNRVGPTATITVDMIAQEEDDWNNWEIRPNGGFDIIYFLGQAVATIYVSTVGVGGGSYRLTTGEKVRQEMVCLNRIIPFNAERAEGLKELNPVDVFALGPAVPWWRHFRKSLPKEQRFADWIDKSILGEPRQ